MLVIEYTNNGYKIFLLNFFTYMCHSLKLKKFHCQFCFNCNSSHTHRVHRKEGEHLFLCFTSMYLHLLNLHLYCYRSSKRLKMEAGYNSHSTRLGADTHYGEDMFNQSGPYMVSPSSYYYNSPPPVKPRSSNLKGDNQALEMCVEDNLARRLMFLTNALNQGKPIRVDDLLSLRPDNEVLIKQALH